MRGRATPFAPLTRFIIRMLLYFVKSHVQEAKSRAKKKARACVVFCICHRTKGEVRARFYILKKKNKKKQSNVLEERRPRVSLSRRHGGRNKVLVLFSLPPPPSPSPSERVPSFGEKLSTRKLDAAAHPSARASAFLLCFYCSFRLGKRFSRVWNFNVFTSTHVRR